MRPACFIIDDWGAPAPRLAAMADHMAGKDSRVARFDYGNGEDLHNRLQEEYYRVRADGGAAILAAGAGIAGALALAAQLPVTRLALVQGPWRAGVTPSRSLRRLEGFARRNLAICTAKTLIVADDLSMRSLGSLARRMPGAEVMALAWPRDPASELCTNRENCLKTRLGDFLRTGELRKPLAENAEMCIIV